MGERTPGLWRVSSRLQVKSEKRLVADIITGYIPEAEANARFIAAAPDMEAALEGAEKILDSAGVRNWAIGWKVALEDVRAALAKAKGETDARAYKGTVESIPEQGGAENMDRKEIMIDILQVTDPGCCGGRRLDEHGCCVGCGRDFFDPDTGEEVGDGTRVPNAQLQDASLEMLEALEDIRNICPPNHAWAHRMQKVYAAIAKATENNRPGGKP